MKRLISFLLAVLVAMSLPMTVFAEIVADISKGDVTIRDNDADYTDSDNHVYVGAPHGGSVIVQGSSDEKTITVDVTSGNSVNVTLDNVGISSVKDAAMEITGGGDVTVNLEGTNALHGGEDHAALQTSQDGGSLTIRDGAGDGTGGLTAQGGQCAAGIGGGKNQNGSNITIESGNITAVGGEHDNSSGGGAGIGGGYKGKGENIEITGGTVNAEGGDWASGIGGGHKGDGENIHVGGDADVHAQGAGYASGIGGGRSGNGIDITIDEDAQVKAEGGSQGAGIGGGSLSDGKGITIGGNAVVHAEGGSAASGIGGGNGGTGTDIVIRDKAQVTAVGKDPAADVGDGKKEDTDKKQADRVDLSQLAQGGSYNGKTVSSAAPVVPEEAPVKRTSGTSASGYSKGSLWNGGYITRTLFKIENGKGMKPVWSEERNQGVLTVIVENEPVVFTCWLEGLKELAKLGMSTIVIQTANCETELVIANLIAMNGTEYILTQEGETAVLSVDGEEKEIRI